MLLKRLYDNRLAQASYLVGCQATGDAIVIDPARDVEQYVAAAKAEGLKLAYVTETHIHADFLSGTRELAAKLSGARPVLSAEGGKDWSYGWAADGGAMLVKDGATFMVGNIRIDVLHTPGHTPEHICFRITDTKATDRPMGVFTGDFIFVGDVGRPDLLEKAAGVKGTMDAAARQLYASLQRFKQHPDYLQLWPAHGAGSACGKALGAVPSTTLGYERFANWAFNTAGEQEFVERVLEGQPEPPPYFAVMKRLNRDGPPIGRPKVTKVTEVTNGLLVDTRPTAEFAARHVRGSVNVPVGGSLANYGGAILPYDKPLVIAVTEARLEEALGGFASIGLDNIAGWIEPEAALAGRAADTTKQLTPQEASARLADGSAILVDVRAGSEWEEGHIGGAVHVPLATVNGRIGELPQGVTIILQCESGSRSAVAASVLRAHGIHDVANLKGGIGGWKKSGLPLEKNGG